MSKSRPTLNHFGYQTSSPNPLMSHWLESYDGEHPLVDIGCAFGVNTLKALEKGIPTIAIDPDFRHLDILRSQVDKKNSHLLTCVVGALPNSIPFPDNYFSGILCSEVLHFLDGDDVEKSIKVMSTKLITGGKIVISTLSYKYLSLIDEEKEKKYQQDTGAKWPGVVNLDDDLMTKLENISQDEVIRTTLRQQLPGFLHLLSEEELTKELRCSGLTLKMARYGVHSGHPDPKGLGNAPEVHRKDKTDDAQQTCHKSGQDLY